MTRNHVGILALAVALAAPVPVLAGTLVDTSWGSNNDLVAKKANCHYVVPYLTAETLTLVSDCTGAKKGAKVQLRAEMLTLPSGTIYDTCDTGLIKLGKGETTTLRCELDRPQFAPTDAASHGAGSVSRGS